MVVKSTIASMSARRAELTRAAARLFAQKGYHGTSVGAFAARFTALLPVGMRDYASRA
jgi:AcrR family transcriptional regulator